MARTIGVSHEFRIAVQETLEATRQVTIATARREHARVIATQPRPTGFQRYVDGREGAPEDAVKPAGIIVYDYPRIDLVAQFARRVLIERSPFGRPEGGHYRDDHVMYLNGSPVSDFSAWRPGDEAMIANTRPYARKIEFGDFRMRVPGTDHVYAQAAQIVNRSYGRIARTVFRLRSIGGRSSPALIISEV